MNQLIVVIDQGDAGIIQDGQLLSNCPKRLMVIDNWINIDGASTQLVDCPNRSKYLSQKIQISVPKAWWDEDRQLIDRALMQISRLYSNKSNNIFLIMIQSWTVLDKSNKLYFLKSRKIVIQQSCKDCKEWQFPRLNLLSIYFKPKLNSLRQNISFFH